MASFKWESECVFLYNPDPNCSTAANLIEIYSFINGEETSSGWIERLNSKATSATPSIC